MDENTVTSRLMMSPLDVFPSLGIPTAGPTTIFRSRVSILRLDRPYGLIQLTMIEAPVAFPLGCASSRRYPAEPGLPK